MFEIIGIVVVVWIGFVILKGIAGGATKGTLLRASHIATQQGVPSEFARAAINNSERLISARKALAKENKEFASMDAYQQYAAAIIVSYKLFSAQDGQVRQANKVESIKPRNDIEIANLIVRAAGLHPTKLECPKLSYGALGDFLDRSEVTTEYFPNYSGARFWINIGELEYAVGVTVLDPSAQDASGILLSAETSGHAEKSGTAAVS